MKGCGWTEVSLSMLLSSPYRELHDIYLPVFLAPSSHRPTRCSLCRCLCFYESLSWRTADVADVSIDNRNVPDEWLIQLSRFISFLSLAASKLYLLEFWSSTFHQNTSCWLSGHTHRLCSKTLSASRIIRIFFKVHNLSSVILKFMNEVSRCRRWRTAMGLNLGYRKSAPVFAVCCKNKCACKM